MSVCMCKEKEDGGRGRGENRVNENLGPFLEWFLEGWNIFWLSLSFRWSKAISTVWYKASFYQHSQNFPAFWKFSAELHFTPVCCSFGSLTSIFLYRKIISYFAISEFGITSKGTYIFICILNVQCFLSGMQLKIWN